MGALNRHLSAAPDGTLCLAAKLPALLVSIVVIAPGLLKAQETVGSTFSRASLSSKGTSLAQVVIGEDRLTPSAITISAGTTVIWRNEGTRPMRIVFSPQTIAVTCKAPRGFHSDLTGGVRYAVVAAGGSASVCLLQADEYLYQVELADTENASVENLHDSEVAGVQGSIRVVE